MTAWTDFLVSWLLGACVLAVVAAGVAWLGRRAVTGLTAWRVALAGLCLLPAIELIGAGAFVADRLTPPAEPRRMGRAAEADVVVSPVEPAALAAPAAWPAVVLAVGAMVVLGRQAIALVLLRRLRLRLSNASVELRRRVQGVARRLGYSQPLRVGIAPGLRGPLVFGLRRPVLAVPADFETTFTPDQQAAVLAHELGHLANRDPAWHLVATAAAAVNWWNPLVWWVRARHRDAGEAAADEATRAVADGPALLAESLVLLGRRIADAEPVGSLAAAGGGRRSRLARRVERLLRMAPAGHRPWRSGAMSAGLALFLSVAIVAGAARARPDVAGDPWRRSLLGRAWSGFASSDRPTPPARPGRTPVGPHAPGRAVPVLLRKTGEPRSDAEIVARLGLTGDQLVQFTALQAETAARSRELPKMKTGFVERGLEINRDWRAGLQSIFTREQYRQYLDYWRSPPGSGPVRAAGG